MMTQCSESQDVNHAGKETMLREARVDGWEKRGHGIATPTSARALIRCFHRRSNFVNFIDLAGDFDMTSCTQARNIYAHWLGDTLG